MCHNKKIEAFESFKPEVRNLAPCNLRALVTQHFVNKGGG
jgi:hypothetical protein